MKAKILMAAIAALGIGNAQAAGRDMINIVGSSTVYPFTTIVAEHFGKKTGRPTPKVESTGTGGGMKLFCAGAGINTPDFTDASRRIKSSEYETCQKNGVKKITEIQVGYDGIVVANSKKGPDFKLTRKDLFLALARQVPAPDGGKKLVDNPFHYWDEINKSLPHEKIEVLGPPPTSGTRDAFDELALQGGCQTFDWIKAIKKQDKKKFKAICQSIREDGAYIEAGENDNLIVQKLSANPKALGIFGFSFLDQNTDKIKGAIVDGSEPTFENIASKAYPLSRPLFIYAKGEHLGVVPGMKAFVQEYTSEEAFGEDGYLVDKGLIPMPEEMRAKVRRRARAFEPMKFRG